MMLYCGDCREILRKIPSETANCCITSPPYYNLRDYGSEQQIGLENSPDEYIEKLADVFDEIKRILRDDGTLWINIGDSYAGSNKGYPSKQNAIQKTNLGSTSIKNIKQYRGGG